MLFKLVGGTHVAPPDENGVRKVYKKGDLIRSDEDLTVKFKGKFVKDFREHTPPDVVLKPSIPTPDTDAGEGDATVSASPKPVSETKVAAVAELDEIDDPTGPESQEKADDPEPEPQVPANPEPEPEPVSEYGVKVNDEFPLVDEVEIDVYRDKASWYTCIDRDDREVLNTKKLRKKAVPAFLKKYKE